MGTSRTNLFLTDLIQVCSYAEPFGVPVQFRKNQKMGNMEISRPGGQNDNSNTSSEFQKRRRKGEWGKGKILKDAENFPEYVNSYTTEAKQVNQSK